MRHMLSSQYELLWPYLYKYRELIDPLLKLDLAVYALFAIQFRSFGGWFLLVSFSVFPCSWEVSYWNSPACDLHYGIWFFKTRAGLCRHYGLPCAIRGLFCLLLWHPLSGSAHTHGYSHEWHSPGLCSDMIHGKPRWSSLLPLFPPLPPLCTLLS